MTFSRTFREILIADAQVEDLDILLAGLASHVETWLVQPGDDAVARIFAALAAPGLSKLHLLAHGMPGGIALGGKQITAADFTRRHDGAAQRDLDIAFWSCQTGAGAEGQEFVQAVARATGARVAAASSLIGATDKNGSWELDVRTTAPFSAAAREAYPNVLVDHGAGFVTFASLSPGDTNYWLNDTARNYLNALLTSTGQAEIAASYGCFAFGPTGGLTVDEFNTLADPNSKFNFNGSTITVNPASTSLTDYNAAWDALHNATIRNSGFPSPLEVVFTTDATPATMSLADYSSAPSDYVAALKAAHAIVVSGTTADFFGSATGTTLDAGLPDLSGVDVDVSGVVSVAQAAALETAVTGSGTVTLSGGLSDTVADLFGSATGTTLVSGLPSLTGDTVTVTGAVSVAQAVALETAVTGSGTVTLSGGVSDTVAHLFGSATGTTLVSGLPSLTGDTVTVTGAVSVAQAAALETAVGGSGTLTLSGGVSDTVAHLFGSATGTTLVSGLPSLTGDTVTVTGAVSVAQAAALETAVTGSSTVTLSGGVTDTVAHLFSGDAVNAGTSTLLGELSAPSVTISDAVDVAQAHAMYAAVTSHSGTLTLSGGVSDTVAHLFGTATGTTLVSGLPSLSGDTVTVTGAVSVAQAAALKTAVGGSGTVTLSGGVSDTVSHLFGSATSTTLASGLPSLTGDTVTATGAVSVAQAAALKTAVGGSGTVTLSGGVYDTVAHLFGSATGTTLASGLPSLTGDTVAVIGAANVAQAAALKTAVGGSGTVTLWDGVSDTVAHLFGSATGTTLVSGLQGLDNDSVTVIGAANVAQAIAAGTASQNHKVSLPDGLSDTLAGYFGSTDGTTLVSGLSALLDANGWNNYGVAVTVTDDSVTLAQLTAVNELGVNNSGAVINAIADTATNLDADASLWNNSGQTGWVHWYNNITITDSPNLAQLTDILTANPSVELTLSYAVEDTVAHFFGSATGTALVSGLPDLSGDAVVVTGAVSVAQAIALKTAVGDSGTVTHSDGISDTVAHLFGSATGTTLVSGLQDLVNDSVTVTDAVSVAQAVALETAVTDLGAVMLSGGVSDTVAHFFGSATSTTLVSGLPDLAGDTVTVTGAVSVAQAVTLETAVTGDGAVTLSGGVSDTVAHLFGSATGTTPASGLPSLTGDTVTVTDTVNVAQAVALQTAVGSGHTPVLSGGLSDTMAHIYGSFTSGLNLSGDTVTVTDAASIAQLTFIHDVGHVATLNYGTITDTAAHLATLSGSTWTVNSAIRSGTNVIVSNAIDPAELAAIDSANGSGTVTALANLPTSNFYAIETSSTPSWTVSGGTVASVIDAPGSQTIHIAAGGKLNLSGSDGNNVIVFDSYQREQLHVTSSGTTVIFSDASGAVASIATDAVFAATQTIQFSDHSQVSLTDTGGALAINGIAILAGSVPVTLQAIAPIPIFPFFPFNL